MTFASPLLLLLLPPLVPLALAVWWAGMRRGLRTLPSFSRRPAAGPPVLAALLFGVAGLLAIVASAGPQWGERETVLPRRGADVFIVLDVSRSMAASDVAPDRLGAARAGLVAMLDRLGGDRVGLVVFAGDARVRFPLTADLDAAARIIKGLEPAPVLVGAGTSARSGVDVALDAFDPASESGRLLLLITDGDDLGDDPVGVAERIAASGVQFLVLGVGTPEGAAVPVVDPATGASAPLTNRDGTPVITRLNAALLRALAAAAGGQYLGTDPSLLASLVPGRVASLNRAVFDERERSIPIDRSQWFAAAALGLAAAATLAERFRPRGRHLASLAAAMAAALALSACAAPAYSYNQQGLAAFRHGDFDRAAALFVEAQAERPSDPAISLNLAAALAAGGHHDEAAAAARRVLASTSPKWRNRGQASIGHHRFAAGDLPGALDAFKQALIEDPGDETSRHDYEVVLRLLAPDGQPPTNDDEPGAPDQPTPTPGADGGLPGGAASPGASPSAGEGGQPGDTPGGTQQPGSSSGPGGTPGVRDPATDAEAQERLRELDAQVARLIDEAGDEPTAAQALEILRLLAERTRIAGLRGGNPGEVDPRDY